MKSIKRRSFQIQAIQKIHIKERQNTIDLKNKLLTNKRKLKFSSYKRIFYMDVGWSNSLAANRLRSLKSNTDR